MPKSIILKNKNFDTALITKNQALKWCVYLFFQLKKKQNLRNQLSLSSVNRQFKIFLLVALSFFQSFNISANDTFFSIEKSSERGEELADAGGVAKYPIDNFLDFVNNTFTTAQKQLFDKADNFYKSFNPSFNANELRGIDFDFPVTNVIKQEDDIMYQMCKLDPSGEPYFGQYFFDDINDDITKLGIGDLNKITSDGRVKVKITLDDNVDFLKSKTANIEDWEGSGQIFEGGGNQFYNPTAKTKIKSYEILQ